MRLFSPTEWRIAVYTSMCATDLLEDDVAKLLDLTPDALAWIQGHLLWKREDLDGQVRVRSVSKNSHRVVDAVERVLDRKGRSGREALM